MKKLYLPLIALFAIMLSLSGKAQVSISEDFESYNIGNYIADQNSLWQKWDNTVLGGLISDEQVHQGTQAMKVYVSGSTETDVILNFNDITTGRYRVEFFMYVPSGKTGYYNILQNFSAANSEWGIQLTFNSGTITIDANGSAVTHTYTPDTWVKIQHFIDLDNDWIDFYLNDEYVLAYQWSKGTNGDGTTCKLDAMDFYSYTVNNQAGEYYIDDLVVEEIGNIDAPTNLTATVENENDVVLSWDAVENEHLVYYSISRNGAEIATTTENTFTDAHLYPTAYEYQVRAFCGTDYGFSASSTASVTIEGGVERENVLVEVFSRVGCVYCPYTLRALDQMEATGNFNMIILDHQVGNDFEYAPSSNRMTYWSGMRDIFDELYDFDGTPSCVFDGYIGMGGAITDQTTATQYYTAYYEYVKAINSIYDFNIELLNDENNSRSFTLNVSAEKLSNYFGDDNITIVVALAEDLDYTWMGYNKLYNMVRGLYPDENGRTVTFDENNQYSTNFSIEVPQECNISRCKVVAWIENHTIGRVMQSKKIDLNTVVSSISEDSQSVSIYPNPSNGTFTIVGDFVSYEIFDITGKQIMHKEAVSNTETVDLSNYAKGIYTIRANDGNSVKVSKIVVE